MRTASRRGQATVELALGSIVFVGVLMIGIHLAEYSQLSLKVQEAETAAIWETTHHRVQTRGVSGATSSAPFDETLNTSTGVAPRTQQRYEDFDGLSGTNGGNIIGRALTQGSGVRIRCDAEPSLHFRASVTAREVLWDVGGVRCTADASVRAIRIPKSFLQKEDDGFFKHTLVRSEPMPVCGMGLPVGGQCLGALSILTNDWGLTGTETEQCRNGCGSSPYRGMVQRIFNGGGGAGAALASTFAGSAPTSAAEFHFSYAGIESAYTDLVPSESTSNFVTGGAGVPGGLVSQSSRPNCFLGKACP